MRETTVIDQRGSHAGCDGVLADQICDQLIDASCSSTACSFNASSESASDLYRCRLIECSPIRE